MVSSGTLPVLSRLPSIFSQYHLLICFLPCPLHTGIYMQGHVIIVCGQVMCHVMSESCDVSCDVSVWVM